MSISKIKISAVSYINTLPFKYGLEKSSYLNQNAVIQYDNPADCATKLSDNFADIGLVPVGAMMDISNHKIISNYCLAASKSVKSVLLLSRKPIEELQEIYLHNESRTSVLLFKILAKHYWKQEFDFKEYNNFFTTINFQKAGVVIIGDKALKQKNSFKYVYDLADYWLLFSNLPIVFAVWLANKNIDNTFIIEFNKALEFGINNIKLVADINQINFNDIDLYDYFFNCIDYNLDNTKYESIKLYQELAKTIL